MKSYIVEYTIQYTNKTPQSEGRLRYSFTGYPNVNERKRISYDILNMFGLPITLKSLNLIQPFKIYEEQ